MTFEPSWIELATVHLIHDRQLELYGGGEGIRDVGLVESAVMRPQNLFAYESSPRCIVLTFSERNQLACLQGGGDWSISSGCTR